MPAMIIGKRRLPVEATAADDGIERGEHEIYSGLGVAGTGWFLAGWQGAPSGFGGLSARPRSWAHLLCGA